MTKGKRDREHQKWVAQELGEAQAAVQDSQDRADEAGELVAKTTQVNRRFAFLRRRNMFAEGFKLIIKEAGR